MRSCLHQVLAAAQVADRQRRAIHRKRNAAQEHNITLLINRTSNCAAKIAAPVVFFLLLLCILLFIRPVFMRHQQA